MAMDHGGNEGEPRVPRRLLLKSLAAGAVLWEPGCGAPPAESPLLKTHGIGVAKPLETPIRVENRLAGSAAFVLARPAVNHEVEGYASTTSASAGDSVDLCVNVNVTQGVRWDLYRIGYYQGLGARLIDSGQKVRVSPQTLPSANPHTGLLECAWPVTFSVVIDPGWLTGYYLFKLTNDAGFESYVPLVVRESERTSPLLVQASVTTWQAYNRWGGMSLYVNRLADPAPFSGGRGYQVSFDRPYAADADIGFVEHRMVRWLEQQGYDAAYVTNIDIDREPALLGARQLFMTVGHDEYWSLTERNAVQDARDLGLPIAFFSGNTAYRRIRLDDSGAGVERRVITCYKSAALDPRRNAPDTTADYHDRPHARPENELVGLVWAGWAQLDGFPFVVTAADHWIYEGTGVSSGDSLGNIVGYEWDLASNNGVSPAGLEVVSESPALHEYAYNSLAQATVYYPTPSSFVFGAGTIGWAKGLSEPGTAEPRVQRVTENILFRAGLFPEARVVVPPRPAREPGTALSSRVLAGSGIPGYLDGPAALAQFKSPAGVALGPEGELYVCDTGNGLLRKISSDGQVSTLLGAPGGARLSSPTGVVVDAEGNVLVSDTGNQRILVLRRDGTTDIYAGTTRAHGATDAADPGKASFNMPRGLAFDESGALYVADFRNNAIRRVDANGVTTVVSAAGGPTAVAIGPDGTLYYVATWDGAIVSVSSRGERSVLANPSMQYGDRDGPGRSATLRPADGLLVTPDGLIFSDVANNRVRRVAFDAAHTVSTLIGTGRGGSLAGAGPETEVNLPRGLARVSDGYVLADSANHRILQFSTRNPAAPGNL
jgi:DNA-binding beta-propeller fold protein YncE